MSGPIIGEGDLVGEALACRRGGRLVFAGLDLRLPAGGALVLTGSNGSGKSSLLRAARDTADPGRGTAAVARRAGRGRSGALPHRNRLCGPSRRDQAGADSATKRCASGRRCAARQIREWRECSTGSGSARLRTGLAAICRPVSGGGWQLARLVAAPASIWLLDEPTTALDSDGEIRLMEAIAEHRALGGRIAVATHLPLPLPGAEAIRLDDYAVSPFDALASPW